MLGTPPWKKGVTRGQPRKTRDADGETRQGLCGGRGRGRGLQGEEEPSEGLLRAPGHRATHAGEGK